MSQQDVANKPEIGTEKTETDVRPVLGILRETSEETHPKYPTQDQSEQLGDFNNGSEASSRHDSNLHGISTVVSDTMKRKGYVTWNKVYKTRDKRTQKERGIDTNLARKLEKQGDNRKAANTENSV